jgi:hypothetical protein
MIPKSLHTVTTLVTVAHIVRDTMSAGFTMNAHELVDRAATLLGYAPSDDVHGLLEVAARKVKT